MGNSTHSGQLETFPKQMDTPVSAHTLPHFPPGPGAAAPSPAPPAIQYSVSATLWPSGHAICSRNTPSPTPLPTLSTLIACFLVSLPRNSASQAQTGTLDHHRVPSTRHAQVVNNRWDKPRKKALRSSGCGRASSARLQVALCMPPYLTLMPLVTPSTPPRVGQCGGPGPPRTPRGAVAAAEPRQRGGQPPPGAPAAARPA